MSSTSSPKRYAPNGMELVTFKVPGFSEDQGLVCKVDRIGQVQIDQFSLRVVLAESQKKFDAMQEKMQKMIEESYRNGMRDGHAAATSAPPAIAEGAL